MNDGVKDLLNSLAIPKGSNIQENIITLTFGGLYTSMSQLRGSFYQPLLEIKFFIVKVPLFVLLLPWDRSCRMRPCFRQRTRSLSECLGDPRSDPRSREGRPHSQSASHLETIRNTLPPVCPGLKVFFRSSNMRAFSLKYYFWQDIQLQNFMLGLKRRYPSLSRDIRRFKAHKT